MFEFLFKYPSTVFAKGDFVFVSRWPVWILVLLVIAAAVGLAYPLWKRRGISTRVKPVGIWLLQTSTVALILWLLWHPAISVATLKPQQNIVAVVVDDSQSMAQQEGSQTRSQQAAAMLQNGLLNQLREKFQVRMYRMGAGLDRIDKVEQLTAKQPATRIGANLAQIVGEGTSLPIGAVVLMSDGSDNAGGLDLNSLTQIRRQHIPVHTVGFGRESMDRDVEIRDVQVPLRALPNARVQTTVQFVQHGYRGKRGKITVKDGAKVLQQQEVTFKDEGTQQTESLVFNAGPAGAHTLQVTLDPLPDEENAQNNSLTRIVTVDPAKPRILYIEGEPRWEFKFIRRAVEDDNAILLTTMLRTTQNKIYRQGIANPKELEDGFPAKVEELFGYQGLIIGGIEAGYFTPGQQELIKQFVDRRGGGVLFLAGRAGLSDGGLGKSGMADLLPVNLPDRKGTFVRDPATAELTSAGRDSLICRLEENPDRNAERWKKLPYLANYQDVGTPKPGAVLLANLVTGSRQTLPLLITQNYGRGHTALLATAGTWRWQMLQDLADKTHENFWNQLLRYLVTDTPDRIVLSSDKQVLHDDGHIHLQVDARDKTYLPAADAKIELHVMGPEGVSAVVPVQPSPTGEGVYVADWDAPKSGSYLVEAVAKRGEEEVGRDTLTFRRDDGVAESFHREQNRELLEKLSAQTGGKYFKPDESKKLMNEVTYSEAGLTVRETKDIWDMPVVFLAALLLRATEWLLRRKWGVV